MWSELSPIRLLRGLRRNALFTIPAILVLSVTAGATLAMSALLDGVLFTALPLPQSDRLVTLCERHDQLGSWCGIATPQTAELARRSRTIQAAGVGRGWQFSLSLDGEEGSVGGGLLGPGFTDALGVSPALGRFPAPEEMGPEAGRVIVLDHAFWVERFGADAEVVGRVVQLDGQPHTVIGVTPEGFAVPDIPGVQVWRPLHFGPEDIDRRGWRGFVGVARLRDGVEIETAREELRAVYAGLRREYDEIDETWRFDAQPLLDRVVGDVRSQLWMFGAAVALFALIGAANVTNLFLFRALRSRGDDRIRAALGAPPSQRAARVVSEGLLVGAISAVAGVLLGTALLRALIALAPPAIPRLELVHISATALGATLAVTLMLGGGAAVVSAALSSVGTADTNRTGASLWTTRVRSGLVAVETALSLVLVASAVLLARSFQDYVGWDPGFDTTGVATAQFFASTVEYPTADEVGRSWAEAERLARTLPGVLSASSVSAGPLFGGEETESYSTSADPTPPHRSVRWYDAGPGYFASLGRAVLAGREFTEDDVRGAEPVAVVNEALAAEAWPGESPLGQTIVLPERESTLRIVGVVADVPPLVPGRPPEPEIFWSNRQFPRWGAFLVVRTAPGTSLAQVQAGMEALEPALSVGSFRPLSGRFEQALVEPRFLLFLIGVFAVVAAVLAAGGLFAVLTVSVAERMREVGIRVALGASRGRVIRRVLAQGATLSGVGALVGVGLHLLGEGTLLSTVPGVRPAGLGLLGLAVGLLVLASLIAALPPALRASRADPLALLRDSP